MFKNLIFPHQYENFCKTESQFHRHMLYRPEESFEHVSHRSVVYPSAGLPPRHPVNQTVWCGSLLLRSLHKPVGFIWGEWESVNIEQTFCPKAYFSRAHKVRFAMLNDILISRITWRFRLAVGWFEFARFFGLNAQSLLRHAFNKLGPKQNIDPEWWWMQSCANQHILARQKPGKRCGKIARKPKEFQGKF